MSRRAAVCGGFFLVLVSTSLLAGPTVGFDAEYAGDIVLDTGDFGESELTHTFSLQPSVHSSSDWFEFDFALGLRSDAGLLPPDISISRAILTVYPVDALRISLGRFSYRPGFGEVSSPSSFFQESSYPEFLIPEPDRSVRSPSLIQTTLFAPFGSATFTIAPWSVPPASQNPDSVFFPDVQFPSVVQVVGEEGTRVLRSITVIEADDRPYRIADVEVGLEVGTTLRAVAISLLAYRGAAASSTPVPQVVVPADDANVYDIEIRDRRTVTYAFGLDVSVPVGPLHFWTDTALYLPRLLAANTLSASVLDTGLVEATTVETVSGASLELLRGGVMLQVEYRDIWTFGAEASPVPPVLGSLVSGVVRAYPFFGKLILTESVVVSLTDASAMFRTAVSVSPDDSLTVSLSAPLFAGAADTELGQFSTVGAMSWTVTARF